MAEIKEYREELEKLKFQVEADGPELDMLQARAAHDLEALQKFKKARPKPQGIGLRGRWFLLTRYLPLPAWFAMGLAHQSLMRKIAAARRQGGK
jgi:hypothetical protein